MFGVREERERRKEKRRELRRREMRKEKKRKTLGKQKKTGKLILFLFGKKRFDFL